MLTCIGWINVLPAQCCSGGVPIAGNLSLPGSKKGEVQLQLTYDYNRLRSLFNESENLGDRTRQRSTHSSLLEASYGISKSWSVVSLFSYVSQERIIETIIGQRELTRTLGLGDVVILARKSIVDNNHWGLSIGAGPKVPIGRNDLKDDNQLELAADLQPGSGAWDAMFWLSFSKYRLIRDRLNFSLLGTGRLTGRAERLSGRQSYEFGDEFQLLFGFSERVLLGKVLIDPQLMFRFRQVGADFVNELPLPNTGGSFLHLMPGFSLLANENLSFRFSAEFPVFRYVQGTQLATSQKLTASLFFRLSPSQRSNTPFSLP
ncbi:MAG: hypothetical protein MRZ79_06500 [Bacteroidia bacterium]|nr:hypothetical protein [Bacteroidia bacterium]